MSRVYPFFYHIIEAGIIAVGDDGVGLFSESVEIVDHTRTEKSLTILEGDLKR